MDIDYRRESLGRYLDDASAARPTPGGGSVAAVAGALASTMAAMAGGFTVGKEKFAQVEPEINEHLSRLADLREVLLTSAHDDMAAYQGIMAAFRMPKETDEQKSARSEAVREATRASLDVVGDVVEAAGEILTIARRLADIANPNLVSDVGVAAELALGTVRAAAINVAVNLAGYKDEDDAAAVREQTDQAVVEAERLAVETRDIVMRKLGA
jgi:formiminotetrahydrofolate cyclodeaminase